MVALGGASLALALWSQDAAHAQQGAEPTANVNANAGGDGGSGDGGGGGDGDVGLAGGAGDAGGAPPPPVVPTVSPELRDELVRAVSGSCGKYRALRKAEKAQLSAAEATSSSQFCDAVKNGNTITNPLSEIDYFKYKKEAIALDEALDRVQVDLGSAVVDQILLARCRAAICFGDHMQIGIEPLVELPVGKSFSANRGPLADYVNNHDIKIDLAAGVRVWAFRDVVSLSIYLSKPLSDRSVRLPGSDFDHPPSSLRRPYPGLALGLLYDTIWLGLDRDELRNADSTSGVAHDSAYPPNGVIGSSWTLTLALQPVTAFRTSIGAAVNNTKASAK
jgi:hypothetical protein